jgi:hypothetical protein
MTITIAGWDWLWLILAWITSTYLGAFIQRLTENRRSRKKS